MDVPAAAAGSVAAGPGRPPRRRALLPRVGADPLAGLLAAVVSVLCGAPLGLLWAGVAPRADLVPTAGGLTLRNGETKDFLTADCLLFLIGVAAGLALTLLAWRLARGGSPALLLALVAGGALAALVAARTGRLVDAPLPRTAGQAGAQLPLRLHAHAVLLGWPAAAAVTFLFLALRRPETTALRAPYGWPPTPERAGAVRPEAPAPSRPADRAHAGQPVTTDPLPTDGAGAVGPADPDRPATDG